LFWAPSVAVLADPASTIIRVASTLSGAVQPQFVEWAAALKELEVRHTNCFAALSSVPLCIVIGL
jgi:hypothetical protein